MKQNDVFALQPWIGSYFDSYPTIDLGKGGGGVDSNYFKLKNVSIRSKHEQIIQQIATGLSFLPSWEEGKFS